MTSIKELFDLTNKVAIITGGAGHLAAQESEALAEAGAHVVLIDNSNLDILNSRANELSRRHQKSLAIRADITKEPEVEEAKRKILKELGNLDILVNNAGKTYFGPAEKLTVKQWDEITAIHLRGTFLWIKSAIAIMKNQRSGKIINIGSIYGIVGADQRIYGKSRINSSAVYAACKGGIISLTRYFAVYLGKYGINVNCISPGGIFNNQDKNFIENYCYRTPLGRMGNETDLKGAIVYLASAASAYVTGHNLVVDGGWTAW